MDLSLRRLILLGPQPRYATLAEALDRLSVRGPLALITAGWEEGEADSLELGRLQDAVPAGSHNLELFHRSESLFADDPELIGLLRDRQDELRHLRDVYRVRLDSALDAARFAIRRQDPLIDLTPERESAIEMVRQLDRQYFLRTSQICDRYEQQLDVANRPHVMEHRKQIDRCLDDSEAILISGGHAAIILNRLRIFGILDSRHHLPVVAWSGGAMALSDQVVLFHDSPPQGRGNPEVLRAGMSMFDEFLPLPDARNRLLLDDALRVQLFSRRFDFYQCVVFDEHTILDRVDGGWQASEGTRRLGESGQLERVNV